VFLIRKYFCHGVPPVGLLLSASEPMHRSPVFTWHHAPCHSPPERGSTATCPRNKGADRPCPGRRASPKPPPLFPLPIAHVRSQSPPGRAPPLHRVSAPCYRPSSCRLPFHAIRSPRRSSPSRAIRAPLLLSSCTVSTTVPEGWSPRRGAAAEGSTVAQRRRVTSREPASAMGRCSRGRRSSHRQARAA
jgi:hypothetical protein